MIGVSSRRIHQRQQVLCWNQLSRALFTFNRKEHIIADEKNKPASVDGRFMNFNEDCEVRYLTEKWGVSKEKLREALRVKSDEPDTLYPIRWAIEQANALTIHWSLAQRFISRGILKSKRAAHVVFVHETQSAVIAI